MNSNIGLHAGTRACTHTHIKSPAHQYVSDIIALFQSKAEVLFLWREECKEDKNDNQKGRKGGEKKKISSKSTKEGNLHIFILSKYKYDVRSAVPMKCP